MSSLDNDTSAYESLVSVNSILFSTALLLTFVWGYFINTGKSRHISQSTGAVIIGFIMGVVIRLLGAGDRKEILGISAELFYFALLPPIIFEASFSLNTDMFMSNLTSILVFAFIGTTISAYVTSIGLWTFSTTWLVGLKNTDALRGYCMTFGALISSTDPVAVMALMRGSKYRPNKTLHSLVFGESVLNDAVAIVLFASYQHVYFSDQEVPSGISRSPLLGFLTVTLGSIIFGVLSGALVSGTYRKSSLGEYPKYEIACMFLSIYLTFSLAELLGLSGIMTIFFFGLILGRYNFHNLSKASQVASKLVFETIAFISETLVFLYLGVVACMSIGEYHWNLLLIIFTMLLIVFARACNVFPLAWVLNHSTRHEPISRNSQIVLWLAGIRGAIAFVLMLRVPARVGDDTRDLLVTTTISVVFITTLAGESLVERVAVMLGELRPVVGVLSSHDATTEPEITISGSTLDTPLFYVPPSGAPTGQATLTMELAERLSGAIEYVDRKYIQRHLGGADDQSMLEDASSHHHLNHTSTHSYGPSIDPDTYYEESEARRLAMNRAVVFE